MNLYVSSGGYNLFWQLGILKRLRDNHNFWNQVNNIYAISSGAVATIYLYTIPEPEDNNCMSTSFCQWWESFNRRSDAKSMRYIYKSGYKFIETWPKTIDETEVLRDYENKNFFYGISHWNKYYMPFDFKWHKVNMNSFQDRTRKAMLSGYAPYFIAKPELVWMKRGIDGVFAYKHQRDFPRTDGNETVQVTANGLPEVRDNRLNITQRREDIIQLWHKLTSLRVRQMYNSGRKDADEFLSANGF